MRHGGITNDGLRHGGLGQPFGELHIRFGKIGRKRGTRSSAKVKNMRNTAPNRVPCICLSLRQWALDASDGHPICFEPLDKMTESARELFVYNPDKAKALLDEGMFLAEQELMKEKLLKQSSYEQGLNESTAAEGLYFKRA